MRPLVFHVLRALLALLLLGGLVAEVAIGVVAATGLTASTLLSRGSLYAVLGVGAIACAQVALIAVWVLLSMVRRAAIFDERALGWVDVIAAAGLLAAVLIAALCVHAGEVDDSPGLGGIGLIIVAVGVTFVLVMVVMRGLLDTATVLRRELDEVV